MGFVENLEGIAEKMLGDPLSIDMSELRSCGLAAQADILESNPKHSGSVNCIEKAVECRSQALSLIAEGPAGRSYWLGALGGSFLRRFEQLRDLEDINKAIQHTSQAMLLISEGHTNWMALLANIGTSYLRRFECLGKLADLNKVIEYLTQVVVLIPDDHADKVATYNNLGSSYIRRFECLGKLADLDKAIQHLGQAILLTPDGHTNWIALLTNVGASYFRRFECLGKLADLDSAIQHLSQAMMLTPDGHTNWMALLANIGASYLRRFECLDKLPDLEKAIEYLTQADLLTPNNHPDKSSLVNNVGSSYMRRFTRLGELSDLDMAIKRSSQAVQLIPAGHKDEPVWLSNLGISYQARFERLGQLADIDKAIDCLSQAGLLTLDGHANKPLVHNNLGVSYQCRFQRLGELADLNRGIECFRQAVLVTPDSHANKPSWLTNLGHSYTLRSDRLGEVSDIDKAIECLTQAVLLAPSSHTGKLAMYSNLGCSYLSRFEMLGELADIDNSIESLSQGVRLTPDDHVNKLDGKFNLGNSYWCRFERLGELSDLDRAIEHLSQVVELTPDGHAANPARYKSLGSAYQCRFERLGNSADLARAQLLFKHGAHLHIIDPGRQIACARKWVTCSSLLGLSPLLAYERCMELVPHLIWLGTTIDQRYAQLTSIRDLATEAAAWAISVQLYDLAIEWLEEGRSIVWNQILQLRTPVDDLAGVDPNLALHLKHVATQLEASGSRRPDTTIPTDLLSDLEKEAQLHRRLSAEWEQHLEQARSIPGFQSFLRPRKPAELKAAATDGPVVIINTHSTRWDALIIFPQCDAVAHIPLVTMPPNEVGKTLALPYLGNVAELRGERVGGFGHVRQRPKPEDPLKASLAALWSVVVEPILNALACTTLPIDELPHVTWCATGPLASVPLHAAGLYDGLSLNAFDLVISSYTPSLSALLASSASATQLDPGVLAVGQKDTPGLPPLPWTVQELAAIKQHAQSNQYLQLDGKRATVDAVLNAMDKHSWVHLSCHATQNPINPAHSAFHLHNGDLTLEAITKRQFKDKGLAFLSACETAQGDGELPDEAVHLAAGMLMAGYPSVIATMWSIADIDGPEVAGRVYAELLKDGKMDHRGAARALHKAVAELREKIGVGSFKRWVPFVHIGV